MSSVTLRNVSKAFGSVEVINKISAEIKDGEFVILIGPSGCGKSTLLRMIAGLEDITDGEIAIDDVVVNNLASKDRDIAMVFQSYALYPHLTVRANMAFSLELRKASKTEIEERVGTAAETLGLAHLLDRYPRQLSGGQRQRVAMGRAIVRDPKVFLFDEPLSNLDAKLRVQMRVEIKALHQRLRTTTVYVTHDQMEAMTMADKIVVMKDGVVEQIGAPIDLYDEPSNTFVAQFIGSPAMNLLPGVAAEGNAMERNGLTLPLPEVLRQRVRSGQALHYGVRPEHLNVVDDGLPFDVDVVEPTGSDTMIYGRLDDVPMVVNIRDRVDVRAGSRIHVTPDLEKVLAFDAETTSRI